MFLPIKTNTYTIVISNISEHVRREVPQDMLYMDDPTEADEDVAGKQTPFSD